MNDLLGDITRGRFLVIPKTHTLVECARYESGLSGSIPIKAVDLGRVRTDLPELLCSHTTVPNVDILVVCARQDVFIPPIELDLCGSCEPVTKAHDRALVRSEIPAVHKGVD